MKMKKVMVLVAAAMAAVLSQAAMVNWSASGLTGYKGGNFYLFDSAKQSEVLAALGAVDADTAKTLGAMALASGSVTSKGKATANSTDVGSVTKVMALVMVGSEFADGTAYTYIVDDVSSMLYTPPAGAPGTLTSALATDGTKGTMSSGTPTPPPPGDVPEPTSGLLLLVGGAMLALRRKQK